MCYLEQAALIHLSPHALTPTISIVCRLLKSLASLFCDPRPLFSIACRLFSQNTRGWHPPSQALPSSVLTTPALSCFSPFSYRSCIAFRINTCKSVSKQTTLSSFRMNTCEKPRGGGYRFVRNNPLNLSAGGPCRGPCLLRRRCPSVQGHLFPAGL
jgi:hypothetical protein